MARRLGTVAHWINEHHGKEGYQARIEPGFCNTDRKIPGTRLRHPGKGRRGNKLVVTKNGVEVLTHNSAETYRNNHEVEMWLKKEFDPK